MLSRQKSLKLVHKIKKIIRSRAADSYFKLNKPDAYPNFKHGFYQ